MKNMQFSLSGFIKKYPKVTLFFLAVLMIDIIYYFGKEIGETLYYLGH
jgi:hypothetical protein